MLFVFAFPSWVFGRGGVWSHGTFGHTNLANGTNSDTWWQKKRVGSFFEVRLETSNFEFLFCRIKICEGWFFFSGKLKVMTPLIFQNFNFSFLRINTA